MNEELEDLLLKLNDVRIKKKLPVIKELLKYNNSAVIQAITEFLESTDDTSLKVKAIRMIKRSDTYQAKKFGPKISKARIDNINPFCQPYGSGRTQ